MQGSRRQVSQGAGAGPFYSAICLRFSIPIAKEFSWLITVLPQMDHTQYVALTQIKQWHVFVKCPQKGMKQVNMLGP